MLTWRRIIDSFRPAPRTPVKSSRLAARRVPTVADTTDSNTRRAATISAQYAPSTAPPHSRAGRFCLAAQYGNEHVQRRRHGLQHEAITAGHGAGRIHVGWRHRFLGQPILCLQSRCNASVMSGNWVTCLAMKIIQYIQSKPRRTGCLWLKTYRDDSRLAISRLEAHEEFGRLGIAEIEYLPLFAGVRQLQLQESDR
jgi:hypothetical protein